MLIQSDYDKINAELAVVQARKEAKNRARMELNQRYREILARSAHPHGQGGSKAHCRGGGDGLRIR